MTTRLRKRLLIAIAGIAVACLFFFNFLERDSYRCEVCFSTRDVYQWRLGEWFGPSLPLTPTWERVAETRFRHDILPANHVHEWKYAQGSPYYCFGTMWGGCAIGGGRHVSDLFQMYESNPNFRTFIQAKLGDGTLSKSNLVKLASYESADATSTFTNEPDTLINSFFTQ